MQTEKGVVICPPVRNTRSKNVKGRRNLSEGVYRWGREKGHDDGIIYTALNMLKDNLAFATIAKHTNHSLERLQTINVSLAN